MKSCSAGTFLVLQTSSSNKNDVGHEHHIHGELCTLHARADDVCVCVWCKRYGGLCEENKGKEAILVIDQPPKLYRLCSEVREVTGEEKDVPWLHSECEPHEE